MTENPFFTAIEQTWPAAQQIEVEGWIVRQGLGGGSRVSSAVATTDAPDIKLMEVTQASLGQPALVMVRDDQEALDETLKQMGYRAKDPTLLMTAAVAKVAEPPPPVRAFTVDWPPLKAQLELWAANGIGPDRIEVMNRALGPKCSLIGRVEDQIAGTGYLAIAGSVAMVHALEVRSDLRRQRVAFYMMRAAAIWAQDHGAQTLCVAVTHANEGARALYTSLGLETVGHYHYREKPLKTVN